MRKVRGKAMPLLVWTAPEDSGRYKLPHFKKIDK
jgi:hypothetical protein